MALKAKLANASKGVSQQCAANLTLANDLLSQTETHLYVQNIYINVENYTLVTGLIFHLITVFFSKESH